MKTMKNFVKMMLISILAAGMMTLTACSDNDVMKHETKQVRKQIKNIWWF